MVTIHEERVSAAEYTFRARNEQGQDARAADADEIAEGWRVFLDALPDEDGTLADTDLSDPAAAVDAVRSALAPENLAEWLSEAVRRAAEAVREGWKAFIPTKRSKI